MRYDPNLTITEALELFYQEAGFDAEDSQKSFYRVNVGPLVTYIYNPEGRKKVIHLHDVEHVLYEIDTTVRGETEVSAISLTSRGEKPLVNYLYGAFGVVTGLIINRHRTIKGLIKGASRKSIFAYAKDRDISEMKVGELRQELGILF